MTFLYCIHRTSWKKQTNGATSKAYTIKSICYIARIGKKAIIKFNATILRIINNAKQNNQYRNNQ